MDSNKLYQKKDEKLFEEVKKLMNGDESAYAEIYHLSEKYIYKIIHDIVKNHQTTEDLMQETYLQIYKKIGTLQDAKAFYAWAGRIATNFTFRHIKKYRKEILLETEGEEEELNFFETVKDDTEEFIPESVLMNKEKQRLIAEIIDNLSVEQKLSIQYYYYEEMSVSDISVAMECSTGTVKSRLNYARKAIKEAVVDLDQKKGTRLYSLSAAPLFYFIFQDGVSELAVSGVQIAGSKIIAEAIGEANLHMATTSATVGGASETGTSVVFAKAIAVSDAVPLINETVPVLGTSKVSPILGNAEILLKTSSTSSQTAKILTAVSVKAIQVIAIASVSSGLFYYSYVKPGLEIENTQKIQSEYSDMIETYNQMGVPEEEVIDAIKESTPNEVILYEAFEEYCKKYKDIKIAYQNVLTEEQYAAANDAIFSQLDQVMATSAIGIEDVISFLEEYPDDEIVQNIPALYVDTIYTAIEAFDASINLMNDPESKLIMSSYFTPADITSLFQQGYNVPMAIQSVVQQGVDVYIASSGLETKVHTLSNVSEKTIQSLQEYAQYFVENEEVNEKFLNHQQNTSKETKEYYQQMQEFLNKVVGGN